MLSVYKQNLSQYLHSRLNCAEAKMFLLALCLVGTAMAMPAIPAAPALLEGVPGPVFISHPQLIMDYAASPELAPLTPLEIEPEPKGELPEDAELPEISEEPKETPLEPIAPSPELPKPLDPEAVTKKFDFNPSTFITDWIHKVQEYFHLKNAIRTPMYMYPGYAVIVDTEP